MLFPSVMLTTSYPTNNMSLHSLLKMDKVNGSDFTNPSFNLSIVFKHEKISYVTENHLTKTPPNDSYVTIQRV